MVEGRQAAPQADEDRRRAEGATRERRKARHRGGTILALGILGVALCFPFGFAAWSMGSRDLNQMRIGRMDPAGEGLTRAGKIVGMVGAILGSCWALVVIASMALGLWDF